MFLFKLNKKEKEVFCKLANYVACVDGIAKEEIELLDQYNLEMGTQYKFETNCKYSIEELTQQLSSSTLEARKIIAFELIGLANSDSDYSSNEIQAVTQICFALKVDPNTQKEMENLVEKLMSLYHEVAELIKVNEANGN